MLLHTYVDNEYVFHYGSSNLWIIYYLFNKRELHLSAYEGIYKYKHMCQQGEAVTNIWQEPKVGHVLNQPKHYERYFEIFTKQIYM